MIYPQNFEQKIGFSEIRQLIRLQCLSTLGEERIDAMTFRKDILVLRELHEQTREFMQILNSDEDFPNENFFDVRPSLKRIRIEGTYLEENELFDLKRSLETIEAIILFLRHDEPDDTTPSSESDDTTVLDVPGRYPALKRLIREVSAYPQLTRRIGSILDKYGKIKDTASPDLQRIRRELIATESGISRSLNSILRQAQQEGLVEKDVTPTLRDGRLVIPVNPSLKRKIRGIVHDESATGKTVYIEPAEVVEANNRIRELEAEERREIIRILQEFSQLVRPLIPNILKSYELLAEIDFIRAKAVFGASLQAVTPIILDKPLIDWTLARHPLLQLSLAKQEKKIVPLDIKLEQKKRILIISGPNAGGKSVCLKTVGLLQYMAQCGVPVPMGENSRVGLFHSMFIDIGDEQSIEDDLSTYSSHLLNMKNMMKHCDGRSLILIDEFGSGTEPQIGGAMAEAVLKRFHCKHAFGVITTHYQNLKHFADEHEGVVNGAMLYDRQHMQALFQLQIGNPGSSFAVEIARKIGIPEDVIADAANLVGHEYINADKYLQDIVRDKRYWENKRQNIHQREKQMEQTIAQYETEINELRQNKRDILKKAKEEAEQLISNSNAQIERTIKTIREAQAEKETTKSIRRELEAFKTNLKQADIDAKEEEYILRKMKQLQEKQKRKAERKESKNKIQFEQEKAKEAAEKESIRQAELANTPPTVGDTVRIKGQTSVGVIEEINGKTAIVTFGMMRTNVKKDRLERAEAPKKEETKSITYVSKQTQDAVYEKKLQFKQDIDVRGMRGDEAINAVTYFIDDAILLGVSRVRILHGTGNGILRTLIRQYLNTVHGVNGYRDEHVQFGGAGITVVELK
ncbi:MAG: Smr/MutS family protein [Paraprevotella sp.]|nr:Smr/MutS family protein [Paraprevotella sp.]